MRRASARRRSWPVGFSNAPIPLAVRQEVIAEARKIRESWPLALRRGTPDNPFHGMVVGMFSWTVAAHRLGHGRYYPTPTDVAGAEGKPYRMLEGELIDQGALDEDWRKAHGG